MTPDRNTEAFTDLALPADPSAAAPSRVHWLCASTEGDDVLDVGCGDGLKAIALGREGHSVVGLDDDTSAVDAANARLADESQATQERVRFEVGEVGSLGFDDGSFETVLMGDVLQHHLNWKRPLTEACRVLKPGGRVVVTVPYAMPVEASGATSIHLHKLLDELTPSLGVADIALLPGYLGIVAIRGRRRNQAVWRRALAVAELRLDEQAEMLGALRAAAAEARRLEEQARLTVERERERAAAASRQAERAEIALAGLAHERDGERRAAQVATERVSELQATSEQLENDRNEARGELERQRAEARGELERQRAEARGELERQRAEARADVEREREATSRLSEELTAAHAKLREQARDADAAREKMRRLEENLATAAEKLARAQDDLGKREQQLEVAHSVSHEREQEISALRAAISAGKDELAAARDAQNSLTADLRAARERLEARERELAETLDSLKMQQHELAGARGTLKTYEHELEQAQAAADRRDADLTAVRAKLDAREADLTTARALVRKREKELVVRETRLVETELRAERFESALTAIRAGGAYKLMRVMWRLRRPFASR
jgi:SAM-dependent methyltransferase